MRFVLSTAARNYHRVSGNALKQKVHLENFQTWKKTHFFGIFLSKGWTISQSWIQLLLFVQNTFHIQLKAFLDIVSYRIVQWPTKTQKGVLWSFLNFCCSMEKKERTIILFLFMLSYQLIVLLAEKSHTAMGGLYN